MAGLDEPDRGEIRLARHATAGFLDLSPSGILNQNRAVQGISGTPATPTAGLSWQARQTGLVDRIDDDAHPDTLSGGERTRLALSRFLADPPDVMLLDEPTNNLDLPGFRTVIRLLDDQESAMDIVSHDRYLLDSLVTRIVEIENGNLVEYAGNYSFYREEKERLYTEQLHRFEEDRKQQRQVQDAIKRTRQWAEKAHRDSTKKDSSGLTMGRKEFKRAKAMKMEKKAKNDIRRLERMVATGEKRPQTERSVHFDLSSTDKQGRRLLEATSLAKSYGSLCLFHDSHFQVRRGEKVALFGPNGCGKTTLIRLIRHLEEPDSGTLWLSPGAKTGILGQELERLPAGKILLDYLIDKLGKLDGQDRAMLAQLGLSKRHLEQTCDTFSLGEQMKIKLVELIMSRHDFLILDEPPNYLDLHAREQLEKSLVDYPGTLLIASHDARLLQKVCDKVLLFGDSQIRRLEQSFSDFFNHMFVDADR
jgi:macrolide transport system ATP-binding/permease protein